MICIRCVMMCVCVYWTAVYISPLSIAHAVFFFLFILTDCGDGCQNGPCGEGTDEEEGNHNYCGTSWADANSNCTVSCYDGATCPDGTSCFANARACPLVPPPAPVTPSPTPNNATTTIDHNDDDCASSCYKIASSGLRLTTSKMEECLRTNCGDGGTGIRDIDMVEVASTKRERGEKSDTDGDEGDCVSKCTDGSKKKRAKAGDDDMEKCLAECASDGGTCIASCPAEDEEEKEDKRGKKSMKGDKRGEDTEKASDCVEYCETCEFNCLRNRMAPGTCECKYPPDNNDEKNVGVVLTSY